ncbi:MAG: molybdopterin-dependent oxidoreductase [Pseudomonadota bacterium]
MAGPQLTSNHWGIGLVHSAEGRVTRVDPDPDDPNPSPINDNIAGSLNGRARVLRPAIREGWLNGTGTRGRDAFVEADWDTALDHIAAALTRIRADYGNEAIYAGSYGWASAGRFHHAQSQLRRFLNCFGGFVASEGNYSYNAAKVAMPHIVGGPFTEHLRQATRWSVVAEHSDLVVAFGGLAGRNMQICDGGNSRHRLPAALRACAVRGVEFINVSPLRGDMDAELGAAWMPCRPGSDTALMLALAQTLVEEKLHDRAFLDRYTEGFERVAAYLSGAEDGTRKDADWAAPLTGLAADDIRALARKMARSRTLITCAASLQRADWGEQPLWACVTLACLLGQIGLPGGGYGIGYAVNGHVGAVERPLRAASLPQGVNRVSQSIPVAMVAEMLLKPGQSYRYNGQTRHLPHARAVWWAGGNPFHHHQNLRRLAEAFQRPELIIVNDVNWTATARHADIVLPVAAATERRDFGAGKSDNVLVPMAQAARPPGDARVEYDIYADLAARLGIAEAFTEGLDQEGWLRRMWSETQRAAADEGHDLPNWDEFMAGGAVTLPDPGETRVFLDTFRADPEAHPRPTPSSRIELYSQTVADMGLTAHATWAPPRDAASPGTLALLSGQPGTRLHSQHDNGALSLSQKIAGREPVLIHPEDAADRGIADGQIVVLENARGRCLAGAKLTPDIARGVLFLWTGAWYDPDEDGTCRHGNPNVLTHDLRTSDWSQGPASHSCRVTLRPYDGATPPPVQAHDPPPFTTL